MMAITVGALIGLEFEHMATKGYDVVHDTQWEHNELLCAAADYLRHVCGPSHWPWPDNPPNVDVPDNVKIVRATALLVRQLEIQLLKFHPYVIVVVDSDGRVNLLVGNFFDSETDALDRLESLIVDPDVEVTIATFIP